MSKQHKDHQDPESKAKKIDDGDLEQVSGGLERIKGTEEERPEGNDPTGIDHRLG